MREGSNKCVAQDFFPKYGKVHRMKYIWAALTSEIKTIDGGLDEKWMGLARVNGIQLRSCGVILYEWEAHIKVWNQQAFGFFPSK